MLHCLCLQAAKKTVDVSEDEVRSKLAARRQAMAARQATAKSAAEADEGSDAGQPNKVVVAKKRSRDGSKRLRGGKRQASTRGGGRQAAELLSDEVRCFYTCVIIFLSFSILFGVGVFQSYLQEDDDTAPAPAASRTRARSRSLGQQPPL